MLKGRKHSKDSNALRSGSDGSPSRKKRRTNKVPKTKCTEEATVKRTYGHDQPASQPSVISKNEQLNLEVPHHSGDTSALDRRISADKLTSTTTKAVQPAFDPPKAPRAHFLSKYSSSHLQIDDLDSNQSRYFQPSTTNNRHGPVRKSTGSSTSVTTPASTASSAVRSNPQNTAPNDGGDRPANAHPKCECNLPDFFTAYHHRIPNPKNWSGDKEEFLEHVRNIAKCKFHAFDVKGACRKIVKSHEASLTRNNEVQLFRATDLASGILSNGNGRHEVHRGRSQSTIAPDNFYVPKQEALNDALTSQPLTTISLSPDRASRARSITSDYSQYNASNIGSGMIYPSEIDEAEGLHSKTSGRLTPHKGAADKEAQDVIDWAADLLKQELVSTSGQRSPTRDTSPSEHSPIQHSPDKPVQVSPSRPCSPFKDRAKRHQSLPARLATPGPVAAKASQTSGDRVKAFAREKLAKVPNLSLLDIKRVVEELDRRLTDIEADKEATRSTRSSERSENVTPSNILHYSSSRGFRNEMSASTSSAGGNTSASTLADTNTNNFTPVNQPVSTTTNTTRDANAMGPPPLPPKPKSKSIAQQKLEKPELSAHVPVDQRLPEEEIIQLGRRKFAYHRHEGAPYAFNYRGKLRKDYRYLLTKIGGDGRTVWIAEEVARLS